MTHIKKFQHECPNCGIKIPFYKKLFLMDTLYTKPCSNCNAKLKIKAWTKRNILFSIITLIILVVVILIEDKYTCLSWIIAVVFIVLGIINAYFSEIIVKE